MSIIFYNFILYYITNFFIADYVFYNAAASQLSFVNFMQNKLFI